MNFDVLITAAFPLDGSVTITTTVATTPMSRTAVTVGSFRGLPRGVVPELA